MMLSVALLLLSIPGGPLTATTTGQQSALEKNELPRLDRLAEIAESLQDPASDGVALMTEAARLCGFAIWNEDRAPLLQPTGSPPLHLALTDTEIREYVQMFRDGHSVALEDLIAGIDVLYQGIGATESCGTYVHEWIDAGVDTANGSARALNLFLADLGAFRAGGDGDLHDAQVMLDPLQALLLVRVLTEEIGVPLRRAIARDAKDGIWRPGSPAPQSGAAPGWAEDSFVGGITGLYEAASEVSKRIKDKVGDHAERMGKANAIAMIAKFIATYTFLEGETRVEPPGQPLVRTKDTDPGTRRTLVVRFTIDGTRVTDWMKDNRKIVALAGLDLDMPKSGALAGIETDWDIKESRYSTKTHLIRLVPGSPDISKVKTDANGEARISVEGAPQAHELDPKTVMPDDHKVVKIVITPQVKSTEMQQDLVDAVTGAIGIKNGPGIGWLAPVIETLYRMKWRGAKILDLRIQDWTDAETIGQLEVSLKARGTHFYKGHSYQETLDRQLTFTDVVMEVVGGEMPGMPDPEMLKYMPPEARRQMEEGLRQMAEAAKQRAFLSSSPGVATMHINDRAAWTSDGSGTEGVGCGVDAPGSGTRTVRGSRRDVIEHGPIGIGGNGLDEDADLDELVRAMSNLSEDDTLAFQVDADLEAHTAKVTWNATVEAHVVETGKTVGAPASKEESTVHMRVFDGLKLEPPFDQEIVVPLKETDIRGMNAKNYYGVVSIPFEFGPDGRFSGRALVSYSVTRKIAPDDH